MDEYLHTAYEPDCEYIAGRLEDRNVGKRKHGRAQGLIYRRLAERERELGFEALLEQRVQLSSRMVRIPDVCLVSGHGGAEVITTPPLLWVEVLSPEDRWSRVQTKISDVLEFGVPVLWIVDPYTNEAWTATARGGVAAAADSILRCEQPPLELDLTTIWREL